MLLQFDQGPLVRHANPYVMVKFSSTKVTSRQKNLGIFRRHQGKRNNDLAKLMSLNSHPLT